MRIGVDTSVLVAAVHANHPAHTPASRWLDRALGDHDVIIAHHSLFEAYAVLTRLPAPYRLSPAEAETVLRETLATAATVAPFDASTSWSTLRSIANTPAAGGASYDAFIIVLLREAAVEAIVTYNLDDFRRLAPDLRVAAPLEL